MMLIGTTALFVVAIWAGGGTSNITNSLYEIDPGLITPYGIDHFLSIPWVCCFWLLVGIGVIGLPYVSIRCLSYKDTKAMHRGMIVGTVVVGWLLLGMHSCGAFARVLIPGLQVGDLAIPQLTLKLFPPWFAGIFLASPLAAIMSTVDSQLLLASSAIVRDLYNYINPKKKLPRQMAMAITAVLGIIVYLSAFKPPGLLVWINLWAIGGLEATFLIPTILGLYWKRANGYGALASMFIGIAMFILLSKLWLRPFALHPIVPTLLLALLVFVVVSYATPRPSQDIIEKFWGI
jgi:sodium/pantothenate symporter